MTRSQNIMSVSQNPPQSIRVLRHGHHINTSSSLRALKALIILPVFIGDGISFYGNPLEGHEISMGTMAIG